MRSLPVKSLIDVMLRLTPKDIMNLALVTHVPVIPVEIVNASVLLLHYMLKLVVKMEYV